MADRALISLLMVARVVIVESSDPAGGALVAPGAAFRPEGEKAEYIALDSVSLTITVTTTVNVIAASSCNGVP